MTQRWHIPLLAGGGREPVHRDLVMLVIFFRIPDVNKTLCSPITHEVHLTKKLEDSILLLNKGVLRDLVLVTRLESFILRKLSNATSQQLQLKFGARKFFAAGGIHLHYLRFITRFSHQWRSLIFQSPPHQNFHATKKGRKNFKSTERTKEPGRQVWHSKKINAVFVPGFHAKKFSLSPTFDQN